MILTKGIYPVVHTPLTTQQALDENGFKASIEYYLNSDVAGLTILGSGGELPYFSDHEQLQIIAFASHIIARQKSLLAGVNAYSANHAIQKIIAIGGAVDAVLLLLNDYYGTDFEDYFNSIRQVAANSPLPIVFYYFPQITRRFFSAKQLTVLLGIDNVIGIKDSSLHVPTARKLLQTQPDTLYFSGLSLALTLLKTQNLAGAICPLASLLPNQCSAFFESLTYKKSTDFKDLQQQLKSVMPIVNSLSLPASVQYSALKVLTQFPMPLLKSVASSQANVKQALQYMGVPISANVRAPLPSVTGADADKIAKIVAALSW